MEILGILSVFDSAKLESREKLIEIYKDETIQLFADQNPLTIEKSIHKFEGIFGFLFENKSANQTNSISNAREGNFVKVLISGEGELSLTTDKGCRKDIYYVNNEKLTAFSTRLDTLLELLEFDVEIDQLALAHSLSIYGSRSPKKSTPYKGISRLGYRESLEFKDSKLTVFWVAPLLPKTDNTIEKRIFLENYSDSFISALDKRSSSEQNIVLFSSGWDSSAIVAGLNHLVGNDKITCVIGEMIYSTRAGVINNFEISRAKKICKHFGIELKIVPLDYSKSLPSNFDEITNFLKSNHLASFTAVNHFLLTESIKQFSGDNCRVFAGEISDGAHNLGFSQFVSIFHPNSLDFREYSDKMMSYLFGPSFIEFTTDKNLEKDPVWLYFRNRSKALFDKPCAQIDDRINQFLQSFFLRNNRLPFASRDNLKLLTSLGAENYEERFMHEYFTPLKAFFSTDYMYSLYLHLYNSFHWQGSTVNSIEIVGDYFGLQSINPFHDERLLSLLQSMPENFGRGLDLNPTKYPLKWTLENRLNYPMHLNSGYHAYTYDTNPQFNHSEEILFHSAFLPRFRQVLNQGKLVDNLNADYFDINYIKDLTDRYKISEKVSNDEFSDLFSLCMHSLIS
jgi:hypothetical protein